MEKLKWYASFLREHKNAVKTAVIIVIVIAAVLLFGLKGEKSELSDTISGQSSEGTYLEDFSADTEVSSEKEEAGQLSGEGDAEEIYVDIGGQVKKPGVYPVKEGTRIFEVIEQVGGFTEQAEISSVNQAETVTDGQKIWIPSEEEAGAAALGPGDAAVSGGKRADGKININTADSGTLQEIPGVGPVTAEKIIAYRTSQGKFSSIEEIKNVSGIGEKTFEKMKDKITV